MALKKIVAALFIIGIASTAYFTGTVQLPGGEDDQINLQTFESEEDFIKYLNESGAAIGGMESYAASSRLESQSSDIGETDTSGDSSVKRYSETNVQEQGIQESDILKTDGEHFYFSPERHFYGIMPVGSPATFRDHTREENLSIFNSLPPENVSEKAQIEGTGKLLLKDDTLVVVSNRKIKGIDVSDRSNPKISWEYQLNSSVVTSRLYDGDIYLVLRKNVYKSDPCPLEIAEAKGPVKVRCTDIYHPSEPVEVDTTYNILKMSTGGEIKEKTSFVGSTGNSEVYMSEDSIYTTYLERKSRQEIFLDFMVSDRAKDIFDSELHQKMVEIESSDMDSWEKMRKMGEAFENYTENMTREERQERSEEIEYAFGNYTKDHLREFSETGIVKVSAESLEVDSTGKVPGKTLNQFSMDQYNGDLRIATTVGANLFGTGGSTENDLYVLGDDLDIKGSVKGMGVDERIYSVRFIDDQGYVVTFRRIDPFHVLDLSEPSDPTLEGELKLPGFSSYLHPLSEDRILGIGEEDGKVKAVVFDVSDPTDPKVEDDRIIDSYGSEISQTHHAFMIDRKHKIFFLPASKGGYIFSYKDGLEEVKRVDIEDPLRARYINDYLYIFSNHEIAVVDETDWETVNTLQFREEESDYGELPVR
ncbi:MAG: beta-propeller domain-containing protein [Candidatus Nanohaloarchaeota archaeon QJJ-9]|nr:beta-propeller domain-containing protein [Candidatus Nanohaloarchaeota archaeon QJJ-9]